MSIRQSIASALLNDTGVSGIVGTNVFPIFIPETVFLESSSALAYHFISDKPGHLLVSPNGKSVATVKFIAESKNYATCDAILEAVRQAFDSLAGSLPGGISLMGMYAIDDDDEYAEPDDASDRGTYSITVVYRLHYRLAKPARFD